MLPHSRGNVGDLVVPSRLRWFCSFAVLKFSGFGVLGFRGFRDLNNRRLFRASISHAE